jgi:hypothetical protein
MKKFLLFFLLLFPIISQASYYSDIKEIKSALEGFNATVIGFDGGQAIIDKGLKDNLKKNVVIDLYRPGKEIIHPVTGEKLGRKMQYLGEVKITDIYDKFSYIAPIGKISIKQGDIAKLTKPYSVSLKFINVDKRQEALLRAAFSQYFDIVKDGKLKAEITQSGNEGFNINLYSSKTNALVANKFISTVEFTTSASTNISSSEQVYSEEFTTIYRVITAGDYFGDGFMYVAAATEEKIDIFKFTGTQFQKVATIDDDFDNIISIDTANLNRNDRDELFVSVYKNRKYMDSKIYEVKDKKFKIIKDNERFIFREIDDGTGNKIICQKISPEGRFLGKIKYYEYDNDYRATTDIEGTAGFSPFGFGYYDVDNDGVKDILYIGRDHLFRIYSKGDIIYKSTDLINLTNNYFASYNVQAKIDDAVINQDKLDTEINNPENQKNFLFARVFVAGDKILLIKNIKETAAFGIDTSFSKSSILFMEASGTVKKSIDITPAAVDYVLRVDNHKYVIFTLRNKLNKILFGGKSQIIFTEVQK